MNYSIIGTAGHVDHGKTRLIKALTGIDADRLAEEKKRGITIELGFAYLTLPNGEKAGIIDVPGHEKFIGNMLAGAGSVDLAMLVVAADEGFMPQTREHLNILSVLGVKNGLVALTKIDLADIDTRELCVLEIEDAVKGTFLESAPVVPVSSHTGEGMDLLKQTLYELLTRAPRENAGAPFRLPVDRFFLTEGFGLVVTGTLVEGTLRVGDDVVLYPKRITAKARHIEIHGQEADAARSGRRVAVNLTGVKKDDIQRGDCLAAPGSMEPSRLLDVRLQLFGDTERTVVNNARLHFYHGSGSSVCRVVLLQRDALAKGESCYAQLRFNEPVAAKPGDKFVARFFSPVETVGGGIILDASPAKRRRGDADVTTGMAIKENGTLSEKIERFILERGAAPPTRAYIKRTIFSEDPLFDNETEKLITDGVLYPVGGDKIIHKHYLSQLGGKCRKILFTYHIENPLRAGMQKDEFRTRLLPGADTQAAEALVTLLEKMKHIKYIDGFVAEYNFKYTADDKLLKIKDEIAAIFEDSKFAPPSADETAARFVYDVKRYKQALDALIKEGTVIVLTPQIFIHQIYYRKAMEHFMLLTNDRETVMLGEFRDKLGTSRKYAVAILEHFDRKGFTKKTGDARVLIKKDVKE